MKMINLIYSELNEWIIHVLRSLPGCLGSRLRYYYYRHRLASCGQNVNIPPACYLRDCRSIVIGSDVGLGIYTQLYAAGSGKEKIRIGDHVYLNSNVMINADIDGQIFIGNHCIIGPNVVFRTSNHEYSSREFPVRDQGHRPGTIIVKDDVWIGANVSIIGNLVIGKGAIVGAGSVVLKDVDDYAIVAGVPAKQIGTR